MAANQPEDVRAGLWTSFRQGDITGGDVWEIARYTLGRFLGEAATGLGAGFLGKQAATQAAKRVAKETSEAGIGTAGKAGFGGGLLGHAAGQETGHTYVEAMLEEQQKAYEENRIPDYAGVSRGRVIASGAASGSAEFLGDYILLGAGRLLPSDLPGADMFRRVKSKPRPGKAAAVGRAGKRFAKGAAVGGPSEAVTETIQTYINYWGADKDIDHADPGFMDEIYNAAAEAFLIGGHAGTASAVAGGFKARADIQQEPPDRKIPDPGETPPPTEPPPKPEPEQKPQAVVPPVVAALADREGKDPAHEGFRPLLRAVDLAESEGLEGSEAVDSILFGALDSVEYYIHRNGKYEPITAREIQRLSENPWDADAGRDILSPVEGGTGGNQIFVMRHGKMIDITEPDGYMVDAIADENQNAVSRADSIKSGVWRQLPPEEGQTEGKLEEMSLSQFLATAARHIRAGVGVSEDARLLAWNEKAQTFETAPVDFSNKSMQEAVARGFEMLDNLTSRRSETLEGNTQAIEQDSIYASKGGQAALESQHRRDGLPNANLRAAVIKYRKLDQDALIEIVASGQPAWRRQLAAAILANTAVRFRNAGLDMDANEREREQEQEPEEISDDELSDTLDEMSETVRRAAESIGNSVPLTEDVSNKTLPRQVLRTLKDARGGGKRGAALVIKALREYAELGPSSAAPLANKLADALNNFSAYGGEMRVDFAKKLIFDDGSSVAGSFRVSFTDDKITGGRFTTHHSRETPLTGEVFLHEMIHAVVASANSHLLRKRFKSDSPAVKEFHALWGQFVKAGDDIKAVAAVLKAGATKRGDAKMLKKLRRGERMLEYALGELVSKGEKVGGVHEFITTILSSPELQFILAHVKYEGPKTWLDRIRAWATKMFKEGGIKDPSWLDAGLFGAHRVIDAAAKINATNEKAIQMQKAQAAKEALNFKLDISFARKVAKKYGVKLAMTHDKMPEGTHKDAYYGFGPDGKLWMSYSKYGATEPSPANFDGTAWDFVRSMETGLNHYLKQDRDIVGEVARDFGKPTVREVKRKGKPTVTVIEARSIDDDPDTLNEYADVGAAVRAAAKAFGENRPLSGDMYNEVPAEVSAILHEASKASETEAAGMVIDAIRKFAELGPPSARGLALGIADALNGFSAFGSKIDVVISDKHEGISGAFLFSASAKDGLKTSAGLFLNDTVKLDGITLLHEMIHAVAASAVFADIKGRSDKDHQSMKNFNALWDQFKGQSDVFQTVALALIAEARKRGDTKAEELLENGYKDLLYALGESGIEGNPGGSYEFITTVMTSPALQYILAHVPYEGPQNWLDAIREWLMAVLKRQGIKNPSWLDAGIFASTQVILSAAEINRAPVSGTGQDKEEAGLPPDHQLRRQGNGAIRDETGHDTRDDAGRHRL